MVGFRGFDTRTSKPNFGTSILEAQLQNLEAQLPKRPKVAQRDLGITLGYEVFDALGWKSG